MPKSAIRPHSRYALEAVSLLGSLIRSGRIEQRMTAEELARRAGVSRALLYRIERGDPVASIGAVLEAAAIVGVPLFGLDRPALTAQLAQVQDRLTLLPKAARATRTTVRDDF